MKQNIDQKQKLTKIKLKLERKEIEELQEKIVRKKMRYHMRQQEIQKLFIIFQEIIQQIKTKEELELNIKNKKKIQQTESEIYSKP